MANRKVTPPLEGHVVKEMKIGNTRVKFCDDYCRGQTREEAQAIMDNFCRVCLPHLQRAELKRMEEEAAQKVIQDMPKEPEKTDQIM